MQRHILSFALATACVLWFAQQSDAVVAAGSVDIAWSTGAVTSSLTATVFLTFGSNTTAVTPGDLNLQGATLFSLVQSSRTAWQAQLTLGQAQVVSVTLRAGSGGGIAPPLTTGATSAIRYSPQPTLSTVQPIVPFTVSQTLTAVLRFPSPVFNVTASDLALVGLSLSSFRAESTTEYRWTLTTIGTSTLRIALPAAAGSVWPAPLSVSLSGVYKPSARLSWSDGLASGASTSQITPEVTITFGSAVTGFALRDLMVAGASPYDFVSMSATVYTAKLLCGAAAKVTVDLAQDAGVIVPANAAAAQLSLVYVPTVTFSLSDGLVEGSVTSLLSVVLTMTFGTPVTGASAADIRVAGADFKFEEFRRVTGAIYTMPLYLGPLEQVKVEILPASGAIAPPNAGATFSFHYNTAVSLSMSDGLVPGAVTSLKSATLTATFATEVLFMDKRTFMMEGCTPIKYQPSSLSVYTYQVQWSQQAHIALWIPEHAGAIFPPNRASAFFNFTYAPAVSLSMSDGIQLGSTTTKSSLTLFVTFGSDVAGVASTDVLVSGAQVSSFTPVTGSVYQLGLLMAPFRAVSAKVLARSGTIQPPNAASSVFSFIYEPWVKLNVSDNVGVGAVTNLLRVTVFVQFGTPVSGVQLSDIVVGGATSSGFQQLSPTRYSAVLSLSQSGVVTINVPHASGSISPPNAAADQYSFRYAPIVALSLSDGLQPGDTTSATRLMVTATFKTPVRNVRPSDFAIDGYLVGNVTAVTPSVYQAPITYNRDKALALITCQMLRFSGSIFPPNEATLMQFIYAPAVVLTLSDGIVQGATTTLRQVVITATFASPVQRVDENGLDFILTGASRVRWRAAAAPTVFTLTIAIGSSALVTAYIPPRSTSIFPPNAASNLFRFTYAPTVQCLLSNGVANGILTTEPILGLRLRFGANVTGVALSDISVSGANVLDLRQLQGDERLATLVLGSSNIVTLQVPARSGAIYPPNAASQLVRFYYEPAVQLAFSDELVSEDTTGLTSLQIVATFGTAVTGVQQADFNVSGAFVSDFVQLTSTQYQITLALGNWSIIDVNIPAHTGSIYPQNHASPKVRLYYVLPYQHGRSKVEVKFQLFQDISAEGPSGPIGTAIVNDLPYEVAELLDDQVSRVRVVQVSPGAAGSGKTVVVLEFLPVTHEDLLTVRKSAFALAAELVGYLERVDRGTFKIQTKFLSTVDATFVQSAPFLPCPAGGFVRQQQCPPVILPCANATFFNQCPTSVPAATVFVIASDLIMASGFAVFVLISWRYVIRDTELLQSTGLCTAWLLTWTNWVTLVVYAAYGMTDLALYSALFLLGAAAFTLIYFFGLYYCCFANRRCRLWDMRFKAYTESHRWFFWGTFALGLLNMSSLKLPYMKYYNADRFSMQPLAGEKFALWVLKPGCVVLALLDAVLHFGLASIAIDTRFTKGTDFLMYWVMLIASVSFFVHVYMLLTDMRRPLRISYKFAAGSGSRKKPARPQSATPNPVAQDPEAEWMASDMPAVTMPPMIRVTFHDGPLGLVLADFVSQHVAVLSQEPTGQAAESGLLHTGDQIWCINGVDVRSSGFDQVVRMLHNMPRPFHVDFVRPRHDSEVLGVTVSNAVDATVAPGADRSLQRATGSFFSLFGPSASSRRLRRPQLPPISATRLEHARAQWGVPKTLFDDPPAIADAAPAHPATQPAPSPRAADLSGSTASLSSPISFTLLSPSKVAPDPEDRASSPGLLQSPVADSKQSPLASMGSSRALLSPSSSTRFASATGARRPNSLRRIGSTNRVRPAVTVIVKSPPSAGSGV